MRYFVKRLKANMTGTRNIYSKKTNLMEFWGNEQFNFPELNFLMRDQWKMEIQERHVGRIRMKYNIPTISGVIQEMMGFHSD